MIYYDLLLFDMDINIWINIKLEKKERERRK